MKNKNNSLNENIISMYIQPIGILTLTGLIMLMFALTAISVSGEELFEDPFDAELGKWDLIIFNSAGGSEGDLPPTIRTDMGNPAPSFDNRGDAWCGNGAFSKQTFDYSDGLVIDTDMYVNDARFHGCWVSADFGIASELPAGMPIDNAHCGSPIAIGVTYTAIGPLCWASPNEQGHAKRNYFIRNENGEVESFTEYPADDDLSEWHNYRIHIKPDRFVEFYKDDNLVYTTNTKVSLDYINMPIVLGHRSHESYGPALHDNVRVYSGVETPSWPTNGPLDVKAEYEHGQIEFKFINPSHPEVSTNSYVYIPAELPGNKANIDVDLGSGFVQKDDAPLISTEWVADELERDVSGIVRGFNVMDIAIMIGTSEGTAQAAVMLLTEEIGAEPKDLIELVVGIYKDIRDEIRGKSLELFLENIYKSSSPEYDLPKYPQNAHWALPPNSALVVKIPTELDDGDHIANINLWEYQYLDTKVKYPLNEFNYFLSLSQFPDFPYASVSTEIDIDIGWLNKFKLWVGGVKKSIPVLIGDAGSVTFSLTWPGSDLDMKAIDPDGNIYTGIQITPTMEAITVNNPTPGEWQVIIIPIDIPPEGENFTLTIVGTEQEVSIPEVKINKGFTPISTCTGYEGDIQSTINITNTGDMNITIIELSDEIPSNLEIKNLENISARYYDTDGNEYEIVSNLNVSLVDERLLIDLDFIEGIEVKVSTNTTKLIYEFSSNESIQIKYLISPLDMLIAGNYSADAIVTVKSLDGSPFAIERDVVLTIKEDADCDEILDNVDYCANTTIPEDVPRVSLGINRFALTGTINDEGWFIFDTTKPKGKGPQKSYTIENTRGCSCSQIIGILGLGKGHEKFGCSISAMDEFIAASLSQN